MEFPKHIVATASLVKNQEGKILLVKTKDRGWEIPGGAVEEGEDIITALKREVKEEGGIEISIKKLAACYSNLSRNIIIFDFVSEHQTDTPKNDSLDIDKSEISGIGWFSKDEALARITNESMLHRIQWLFEYHKGVRHTSYLKDPFKVISEDIFNEK